MRVDSGAINIYLERYGMLFTDVPCNFYDSLQPFYLPLNIHIEIFLLHFRETKEVNGPRIPCRRVFWNERP
jgi:hypothetical protein